MDRNNLKILKRNILFVKGENNTLFDLNGKSYLDFCYSLENCLGYTNPLLSDFIFNQSKALLNGYVDSLVLEKLISNTSFNRASLTSGATEANYLAFNLIKSYTKENYPSKKTIVTNQKQNSFFSESIINTEFNNFSELKSALNESTCALIIEPITDNGVDIIDYDYLINAYTLCKALDIVLVLDETKIGYGRSGNRFCYENYGIAPDIVTVSRGLGAGINLGAILVRGAIGEYLEPSEESLCSLNYKALEYVLKTIDDDYLKDIIDKGEYLMSKLCKLNKHNFVLDIRGKGLMVAIELNGRISSSRVSGQMEKKGFLINSNEGNILKFTPPFTITKAEIDSMAEALTEIFALTNI